MYGVICGQLSCGEYLRAIRRLFALPLMSFLALLLLCGCTTYNGLTEFDAYRSAFDKSYETGNAILDVFAQKERSVYLRTYPPSKLKFEPAMASYYVDTADPPSTRAFRQGLRTVKAYNDLLYGLASGATAEALSTKLITLNTSLVSAGKEINKARADLTNTKASESIIERLTALDQRVQAAAELVTFALKYKSRADFRFFALKYYDASEKILENLRDGTKDMFPVLTADNTDSIIVTVDGTKIAAYRVLLADWVLSLDTTILALKRVNLALTTSSANLDASVEALSRSANELEAAAQAARKHIAALAAS